MIGPSWIDEQETDEKYIYKLEKALAIAWQALDCVNTFSNDPQLIAENKKIIKQIEELK